MMKQEHSAGAVLYTKEKQSDKEEIKFLLIKSRYWGFPKGLIEPKENEKDAAKREIREETSLDVTFIQNFSYTQQWFYKMEGELIKKEAIFFLAKVPSEDISRVKISFEHAEFLWTTYEEALKLMKIKANRDLLTEAYNFVKEYEAQRRLV